MLSVRSKRKRRSKPTDSDTPRRSKRGRPMKRAEELSIPRDVLNAQLRKLQKEAQNDSYVSDAAVPSPLEQLPNELLQQIFFHCFEINLPRASLRLAQALSNESTWKALILFAYFDDDEQHPVETYHFLPATYVQLGLEQRVRLQREILSCRWCTLGRIKACLPVLNRLSIVQAWHKERKELEAIIGQFDSTSEAKINILTKEFVSPGQALLPRLDNNHDLSRHFFTQAEAWDEDVNMVRAFKKRELLGSCFPRIITWVLVKAYSEAEEPIKIIKTPYQRISTLAARVLPDQLVRGNPWTEAKLKLLQLLRQGFQFLQKDHILEISAAAVFEGMASAIREKNLTALYTLLELHNAVFESTASYDEPSLVVPTNHPLPAHLFRLATQAGDRSSMFMYLLIRGGADSIPLDDNTLTGWALRTRRDNREVATWLLKYMSNTADSKLWRYDDPSIRSANLGKASTKLGLTSEFTFAEQLGYLEGELEVVPTNLTGEPCG